MGDTLERLEAIRSETPGGVRQEVWGMAVAYNCVFRTKSSHRLGANQVADLDEILLSESAALNTEWLWHKQKGSMEGASESSGIFREKSVRCASRDLSSYDFSLNSGCFPQG